MDKLDKAIERLKIASEMSLKYYQKPLMICYSGGKDSDCLLQLSIMAKIPIEVVHSHTTVDAPETVRYVRQVFYDLECQGHTVKIEYPYYKGKRTSMWDLIVKKGIPPTRMIRYCCTILKETSGANRHIATGVRWAESNQIKNIRGIFEDFNPKREHKIILNNDNDDKRKLFERCEIKAKTVTNPIIDFTDNDVLDFNTEYCSHSNPLYECGFNRIGCIGCPMAGKKRYREFRLYPKYKQMYINAFDRMLEKRRAEGKINELKTGIDIYRWWMGENPNQLTFFEE